MSPKFQWHLPPEQDTPPAGWPWSATGDRPNLSDWTRQLLWQRRQRDPEQLLGFLDPDRYAPTPAGAFGPEMTAAVERLVQARDRNEKVAIWGDFDADGLTATAVLWEGLGQFFEPHHRLRYYVPNRFTESHGLSQRGLDDLAVWGCQLIVTCDTGSTAHAELEYARDRGLAVIVTDHHTLPDTRPPVVALINPRQLPPEHPLADLSGVAVAYKLVEALYARLPEVPQQPLTTLLDLVAIGLIADLVALRGDCRYLAQVGLRTLEAQAKAGVRPGIAKLLELCKRTGDRPSDVAFGLGPRINAVSRIHGDAHFGVELLTSRDRDRAEGLALEAELANTRRKEIQAAVMAQALKQLAEVDLDTIQVIVLANPQWPPGVLGLVASQIAQDYGRPTLLLQTEVVPQPGHPRMARGSARSVNQIDLYELVHSQAHLLHRFGGHPFAAGLSLPADNLPLFIEGINRALRSRSTSDSLTHAPPLAVDLVVTVEDLGRDLFKALKWLEPYGMGNPIPRLLLRQVRFDDVRDHALKDSKGSKQRFFKVEFKLWDEARTVRFDGHWWGHRRDDLPTGLCDVVVELDVNFYRRPPTYEVRLVDVRPAETAIHPALGHSQWVIDKRRTPNPEAEPPALIQCPADWSEFPHPEPTAASLTLSYPLPAPPPPETTWQHLVGIAKYLANQGIAADRAQLRTRLGIHDRTLTVGLRCLADLGFSIQHQDGAISIQRSPQAKPRLPYAIVAHRFLDAVREEHFRQRYFYEVPPQIVQSVLEGVASDS